MYFHLNFDLIENIIKQDCKELTNNYVVVC